MVEPWIRSLEPGYPEAAWHGFIERYRPGILGAIGHSATGPDNVMDVFAPVPEALGERDFFRLSCCGSRFDSRRALSRRLFLIVRTPAVDCSRHRSAGCRLTGVAEALPRVQQRILHHVSLKHHPIVEPLVD